MTSFATALDLSTLISGVSDPQQIESAWLRQAQLLLELISADVEEAAGIRVEAGTGTAILAGVWGAELALPAGPVRSVDSVVVDGTILDTGWYYWNDRASLLRGASPSLDALRDETPPAPGASGTSSAGWGGPGSTIAVTYSWGFVTVPEILRALTLRIAARTIGNVAQVTQESLGSYSVSYGQTVDDGGSYVRASERARLRRVFAITAGTIGATA